MNYHVVSVATIAPGLQFEYRTMAMSVGGACLYALGWPHDAVIDVCECTGASKWCQIAECNVLTARVLLQ